MNDGFAHRGDGVSAESGVIYWGVVGEGGENRSGETWVDSPKRAGGPINQGADDSRERGGGVNDGLMHRSGGGLGDT